MCDVAAHLIDARFTQAQDSLGNRGDWAVEDGPPVLLVQYETDATAGDTIEDGHLSCDAIISAGGVCEIVVLPGVGHIVSLTDDGPQGPDVLSFLLANVDP